MVFHPGEGDPAKHQPVKGSPIKGSPIKGGSLKDGRGLIGLVDIGTMARALLVLAAFLAAVWSARLAQPAPEVTTAKPPIERTMHDLTPDQCRASLDALIRDARSNSDILWVWAEETPVDGLVSWVPREWTRMDQPPRPYAINPRAEGAAVPSWACGFPLNSVSAVSLGGRASPHGPVPNSLPPTETRASVPAVY